MYLCALESLAKFRHPRRRGAPEAINRLRRIPDDEDILLLAGKSVDDFELDCIRVLILVDHDMRPALSDQLSDRFVFEERCKIDEDVIVIEHSSRELIFGECGLDCSDLVFEIEIVRAFAFDCLADRRSEEHTSELQYLMSIT